MAGSPSFKDGLNSAKNKYKSTDERRSSDQNKYDAMEKRGYDDLSNLETYQAKGQHSRLKESGVFDTNTAAQQEMKNANFDYSGDLSGYNSGAERGLKFDEGDYKYLLSKGASDEAIQSHIGTLAKGQVHQTITSNKKLAGDLYRGDMDKSKGIESYDMGGGFNRSDISYLQDQGYSNEEIADYGLSSGKSFGGSTAKFLEKQGRLNTRADNTFDQSANSLPSKMQQKVDAAPIDVNHQYKAPNLDTERDRIDEEINKDHWGTTYAQTSQMIAESPYEHDSQKFLDKHLGMARKAAASRTGLDLSKYKSDYDIDLIALNKQIHQRPVYAKAKADLQGLMTFGDMYRNMRENPNSWSTSSNPKSVESPDFESWYKASKNDIDKIEI